jgi:hypothetical protein
VLLAALIGCSLISGTSFARYRAAMGPETCCKTRCHHHHQHHSRGTEAKRCCAAHLSILPQAASKDVSPALAWLPASAPAPVMSCVAAGGPPTIVTDHDGRSPPGTLLAHHTSALR